MLRYKWTPSYWFTCLTYKWAQFWLYRSRLYKEKRCEKAGGHFVDHNFGIEYLDWQQHIDQDIKVARLVTKCKGCGSVFYTAVAISIAEEHLAIDAVGLFTAKRKQLYMSLGSKFPSEHIHA